MVTTNDYTMFDDGNLHNPSVSRGVEYIVNTNNMTATLVWQYPPRPPLQFTRITWAMSSA